MTSVVPPICGGCKHLTGGKLFDEEHPNNPPTCAAFPDGEGIPWDILLSKRDHRDPYSGDNGVRFEPVDKRAADYADLIFAPIDAP